MRLSYQIPLITGFVLVLTIFVNLFAFQNIADNNVIEYQQEITKNSHNPDPDKLQAFTEISKLDNATREEYMSVLQELSTISTALQNISDNPELYISASGTATSTSISLRGGNDNKKDLLFLAIFDIRTLGEDTPEGRLVTNIIQELIILNMIWMIIVYVLYMLWVRSIFAPIERITENIRRITDNDGYNSISYKKKDEFFPLISAINNLHKSLSIQEKIRSNFLTDLSHEIRTPITAVKCYLEAIEDDVIKLDTKTFGLFQKELDRLITTTEEILYFDQTTNPLERQIHVERLSIKQIVTPLIQEYIPQCQKNNQQIHVEIPKDAIIRMDPSMLSQIIHNIFSNFIKYAGSHSTLTCYYRKDEQYTTIIFIDNGKGVPDSSLPFIKEKFYRVDTGRNREHKSMGIGLSIIDHILRVHGGIFEIENTEPHGLTISLSFPG